MFVHACGHKYPVLRTNKKITMFWQGLMRNHKITFNWIFFFFDTRKDVILRFYRIILKR